MKPTPQLSPSHSTGIPENGSLPIAPMFPPTDYQFQAAPAKTAAVITDAERQMMQAHSLWRTTANLIAGGESSRAQIGEMSVFIGVALVAAAALFATAFTITRIALGW